MGSREEMGPRVYLEDEHDDWLAREQVAGDDLAEDGQDVGIEIGDGVDGANGDDVDDGHGEGDEDAPDGHFGVVDLHGDDTNGKNDNLCHVNNHLLSSIADV